MKHSKKVVSLILAATMLSSTTTAFSMPSDTVIMGEKAYRIEALNDMNTQLQSEITEAIMNTEAIYYNVEGITDGFLNADGDMPMTISDQKSLNNIILTKEDGTKEKFDKFTDEKGTVVTDSNTGEVDDVTYTLEIFPGIIFSQRLVKITLNTEHDTNYKVTMFGKELEYKSNIDKFVGILDSSDEDAIINAVLITNSNVHDLANYNTAIESKTPSKYTVESWNVYKEVVASNFVSVANTQEKIDLATANIVEAQSDLILNSENDDTLNLIKSIKYTSYDNGLVENLRRIEINVDNTVFRVVVNDRALYYNGNNTFSDISDMTYAKGKILTLKLYNYAGEIILTKKIVA